MNASLQPSRSRSRVATATILACCLCIILGLILIVSVTRYLYVGTNAPGLAFELTVSCGDQSSSNRDCNAAVQDLGYGRKRLNIQAADVHRAVLTLQSRQAAGALLVRPGASTAVQLTLLSEQGGSPPPIVLDAPSRKVLPLPSDSGSTSLRLSLDRPATAAGPMILDEIGLFRTTADVGPHWLLSSRWEAARRWLAGMLIVLLTVALIASLLPSRTWALALMPTAIGLAGVLACLVVLAQSNGPDWSKDLRVTLASGTLLEDPGANLNYGIHMAANILQGKGPLTGSAPPWNRMPGYGIVLAAVGFGGDLMHIGVNSVIFLHTIATGIALGILACALTLLAPVWVAATIGIVIAIIPKMPSATQIEGFIQVPTLLVLAAACLFIADVEKRGSARLSSHLLLHAAFAFWFSIRVDALPGWALVSLLLYAYPPRRWPYLLLPIGFALAIAVPWALFKQPLINEFSPTTNSFGASLMVGLWEVPHPFAWSVSDLSYADWVTSVGLDYFGKAGSDKAVREVLRFYLIFPGYFVSLFWHGFTEFWTSEVGFGYRVFSSFSFQHGYPIFALTVIAVAVATWRRPLRLLLLGWILFFNIPIFFLTYSSGGRFYNPGLICLALLSLLLLLDREFYTSITRRPVRAGAAAALGLSVFLFGERLDEAMISSDAFRFATPFASPSGSTLAKYSEASEPVLVPEDIGERIGLDKLVLAPGAERKVSGESIDLSRSGAGLLATITLPEHVIDSRNCRIRLTLAVARGDLAVNIQTSAGGSLLPTSPTVPRKNVDTDLDFNIPIMEELRKNRTPLSLALQAASPADTRVRLSKVVLYRCER